jgi:uncharacterized protein YgbK (DUF1537 family)
MKLVVLADDLSGAAEVAGIAYDRGLSAEVQRAWHPASSADLIVVDANTRSLEQAAAIERTAEVARQVVSSGPLRLFKKVDSLLRGWPRAEIEAILRVTGQSRALLVPANPSRGRTIEDGRYLVDGVPLNLTQFASDPEHPRESADVRELLGGECPELSIPDVRTIEELEEFARQLDCDTLPAGAADFFTAWLEQQMPPRVATPRTPLTIVRPALFVCGSRAASRLRICEAQARGTSQVLLTPAEPAASAAAGTLILHREGRVLMAIADDPAPWSPDELASRLAQAVAGVLGQIPVATLLVEGGATASAVVDQLGWQRFAVSAQSPAGIGVLTPLEVESAPSLIIKPGSYEWPDSIW